VLLLLLLLLLGLLINELFCFVLLLLFCVVYDVPGMLALDGPSILGPR
jgi:hypothetical protein